MERIEFTAPLQVRWRVAERPTPYRVERLRVYLDTTIPSYLGGRLNAQPEIARRQRVTDVWWRRYRERFDLYISEEVKREAAKGDATLAEKRLDVISHIDQLTPSAHSTLLAARLIDTGILPANAETDAHHIAIAATHSMDYLLTWNCKHMANPFLAKRIVQTCELLGFRSPKICTPDVLMRACRHERPHP